MLRSFAVIAVALTFGCGSIQGGSAPTSVLGTVASLGQEFDLRVGGSARISGEPLTITFESVVTDSRCPTNTTCVFEGDAIVRLNIEGANAGRLTLDLHTQANGPREGRFQTYGIRLVRLAPERQNSSAIPSDQYIATLIVSG